MVWQFPLAPHASLSLAPAMNAIMLVIGNAAGRPLPDFGISPALALCAGLVAIGSSLWSLWLHAKLRHFRHRAKKDIAAAELSRSFKKASWISILGRV